MCIIHFFATMLPCMFSSVSVWWWLCVLPCNNDDCHNSITTMYIMNDRRTILVIISTIWIPQFLSHVIINNYDNGNVNKVCILHYYISFILNIMFFVAFCAYIVVVLNWSMFSSYIEGLLFRSKMTALCNKIFHPTTEPHS